jgi:hypothetical protein
MPNGKPDSGRPSAEDCCAECGELVGDEWVSYRRDPADPQTLRWHFGGVVRAQPRNGRRKPIEKAASDPLPPVVARKPPRENVRDFRYPDDLDVFFHRTCAPKMKLPEKLERELASILADILVADLLKTHGSWEGVRKALASGQAD